MRKLKKIKRNKADSSIACDSWLKMIAILLLLSLNWTGLFAVSETRAYFSDQEQSAANFTAATLDLSAPASTTFPALVSSTQAANSNFSAANAGNLDFQYIAGAVDISGDSGLCGNLSLNATQNGNSIYSGKLSDFSSPTTTLAASTSAVFAFELSLASSDAALKNKTCNFSFKLLSWQTDFASSTQGFFDTEIVSSTVSSGDWTTGVTPPESDSNDIVLNEFLPNPQGNQYGHDFGVDGDSMPKGEWVELYNKGTEPVDVSGWYLRDSLDSADHMILIDTAHTGKAEQVIEAEGYLVVYLNKALLNNSSGDSVRLFDADDALVDSYSYVLPADFCNLKPTIDGENDEDGSGIGTGCVSDVPTNKSYARIPDGIGDWVDPIPTPGQSNIISEVLNNSGLVASQPLPIDAIINELEGAGTPAPAADNGEVTAALPEIDEAADAALAEEPPADLPPADVPEAIIAPVPVVNEPSAPLESPATASVEPAAPAPAEIIIGPDPASAAPAETPAV
ncbi:MAG: lamin tail domain-containing protein [Candidatus Buchananbacteria bacterium]